MKYAIIPAWVCFIVEIAASSSPVPEIRIQAQVDILDLEYWVSIKADQIFLTC